MTAKLLPQQKDSSCSMTFVARPESLDSNLEKSGVPATADVIAAIVLYLSKASKLRFEIKFSPTRGLCLRAIAGHSSVLDPCRQLPCLRRDEARRIAAAIHCTSWENVESILTCGLFPGKAVGGVRFSHSLDHLPINTSLHRPEARALQRWHWT